MFEAGWGGPQARPGETDESTVMPTKGNRQQSEPAWAGEVTTRIAIGQVVTSRAGRDAGKTYLVVGLLPDGRVLVADGRVRSVVRPKVKNLRHLWVHRACYHDRAWVADDLRVREVLARWLAERESQAGAAREDRATAGPDHSERKGGETNGEQGGNH